MKSNSNHKKRLQEIGRVALPSKRSPYYDDYINFLSNRPNKPPDKEIFRRFKKATSICYAQSNNGAGLPIDEELRRFLSEYNNRLFKAGLHSMPTSFNIMEGFLKYVPDLNYFELLEEEDFMFSLFDFIDFITSNELVESEIDLTELIVEDLIYNFTNIGSLEDMTFSSENDEEFVISGISMVRRSNEVIVLILGGKKCDIKEESAKLKKPQYDTLDPDKEGIWPDEGEETKALPLIAESDYWKTLASCRIDLTAKKFDVRTISFDCNTHYTSNTDDRNIYFKMGLSTKEIENTVSTQEEILWKHQALFELAEKCLFLPLFFDKNDNLIEEEIHETNFSEYKSPKYKKDILPHEYKIRSRTIYCLDLNTSLEFDEVEIGDLGFQIERSGYWKKVSPDTIGIGKNGEKVHGKTWVSQTSSWVEFKTQPLNVELRKYEKSNAPTAGYIYILRNATDDIDIFKIGLTRNPVEKRAKQLSKTSRADNFLIAHRKYTHDCVLAEKLIHEELQEYRLNPRREFFKLDYEKAVEAITRITKKVDLEFTNNE